MRGSKEFEREKAEKQLVPVSFHQSSFYKEVFWKSVCSLTARGESSCHGLIIIYAHTGWLLFPNGSSSSTSRRRSVGLSQAGRRGALEKATYHMGI